MTTDAQDRAIDALVASPTYGRADVRPMADGSREVWCYDTEGVLTDIFTVFRGGHAAVRQGFRVLPRGHEHDRNPQANWS